MLIRLAYLHLTLNLCKGHRQGHAHFDSTYLAVIDRANVIIAIKCDQLYILFDLHLNLTNRKGQVNGTHSSIANTS